MSTAAVQATADKPILSVRRLRVLFPLRRWLPWHPRLARRGLDGLDLDLMPGEALGIVGETGSGKSTLARALIGQQRATSGSITLAGEALAAAAEARQRQIHRLVRLFAVTDDPRRRRRKVAAWLATALRQQQPELDRDQCAARCHAALARVGLPESLGNVRLRALTDAQRRRLALTVALAGDPQILICDDPLGDLDPAERGALIDLLAELRQQSRLSLIFIAADPALVRRACQRVVVIYLGRVMEQGPCQAVFDAPAHPYTRALLTAPLRNEGGARKLQVPGDPPEPGHPPMGCVFHPRCPMAEEVCVRSVPHLQRSSPGHFAACHFAPRQPTGD